VRLTGGTVEVSHRGRLVAAHARLHGRGVFSTDPQHRPAAHRRYLEWWPSRLVSWAEGIGHHTARLVAPVADRSPRLNRQCRAGPRQRPRVTGPGPTASRTALESEFLEQFIQGPLFDAGDVTPRNAQHPGNLPLGFNPFLAEA